MMRLWVQSYSRQRSTSMPIAALSGIVHAIIIAAWVVATLPPSSMADDDSLSNRVYPQYVPPPDKMPGGPAAVHEVVHFVKLSGTAVGDGSGGTTFWMVFLSGLELSPGDLEPRSRGLGYWGNIAGTGGAEATAGGGALLAPLVRHTNSAATAQAIAIDARNANCVYRSKLGLRKRA